MTKLRTFTLGFVAAGAMASAAGVLAQQNTNRAPADENANATAASTSKESVGLAQLETKERSVREAQELVTRLQAHVAEATKNLATTKKALEEASSNLEQAIIRNAAKSATTNFINPSNANTRQLESNELRRILAGQEPAKPSASANVNASAVVEQLRDDALPTDDEVLRKLIEQKFKNLTIAAKRVSSEVQPCRIYPLAGHCNLVVTRYECHVGFDLQTEGRPERRRWTYVISVDKNRLVQCTDAEHGHANANSAPSSELERAAERAEWAENMFKKGYLSKSQRDTELSALTQLRAKIIPDANQRSSSPSGTSHTTGTRTDQERRLQDVERKLDQILESLQRIKPESAPVPGSSRGKD